MKNRDRHLNLLYIPSLPSTDMRRLSHAHRNPFGHVVVSVVELLSWFFWKDQSIVANWQSRGMSFLNGNAGKKGEHPCPKKNTTVSLGVKILGSFVQLTPWEKDTPSHVWPVHILAMTTISDFTSVVMPLGISKSPSHSSGQANSTWKHIACRVLCKGESCCMRHGVL